MGALDYIILLVLAIGAYSGFKQGLFISIISIVAFIIAIILAFHFMDWGTKQLVPYVTELTFALPFIAFILIFLGVIMLIRGVAFLVKKTLDFTILGSVDSVAGAFLGVAKTAFIISFLLWIANSFQFKISQDWIAESQFYSTIQPVAPAVIGFFDQYTPIIQDTIASIQEIVKSSTDGLTD